MKRVYLRKIVFALAFVFCLGGSLQCMAQSKPIWAQKGEKSMNKKRVSDNYSFKVFNTHGMDSGKLLTDRLQPLLEFLHGEYNAAVSSMTVDSTAVAADGRRLLKISFPEEGGTSVVYAQRVDDFMEFEDYVENVFQFEYYQLYAVTGKNAQPVFDNFDIYTPSSASALCRSIVPGMGQLYKGQKAKGYAIIGGEVVFIGTAIVSQIYKHRYDKRVDRQEPNVDSWRSKSRSWRQMRNLGIGLACGLYVYNLIDAAVSKSPRRLKVSAGDGGGLAVVPFVSTECTGLSFALRF